MAIYVGESLEILNSATDFDGATVLTPARISLVQVEVVDAAATVVLATTTMAWDATRSTWYFIWTAPETAGTYRARITMTGIDGAVTWDYMSIRVKAIPF